MINFDKLSGTISYADGGFSIASSDGIWKKSDTNTIGTVKTIHESKMGAPGTINVTSADGNPFNFSAVDLIAGPDAGQVEATMTFEYLIVGWLA